MNSLDMKTTIFIYILVSYICSLVIGLIWIRYRKEFKGIEFFVFDFLFHSIGLTLASMRDGFHPVLTVIIPNMFMFFGIIFFVFGIACFLKRPINRKPYYLYFCLFTVVYSYFTLIQPDVSVRIILFAALTTPMFVHGAYLVYASYSGIHRNHASSVGIVCVLFIILNIARVYYAVTGGEVFSYFTTPFMETFFVILSQLLVILLTFSLGMMIINKLFYKTNIAAIEREALLEKMQVLATTDSLTGIYNRRKMEELLLKEVERFKRYGTPCSILLTDIDNFKRFNDTYGHDIGDQTLAEVTELMGKNIRKLDFLGRWGGEEFLVILPGLKLPEAVKAAEKLRHVIQEMCSGHLNENDCVTLSIGVVEYSENMNLQKMLTKVDELLYKAKHNGRNKVEF